MYTIGSPLAMVPRNTCQKSQTLLILLRCPVLIFFDSMQRQVLPPPCTTGRHSIREQHCRPHAGTYHPDSAQTNTIIVIKTKEGGYSDVPGCLHFSVNPHPRHFIVCIIPPQTSSRSDSKYVVCPPKIRRVQSFHFRDERYVPFPGETCNKAGTTLGKFLAPGEEHNNHA